MHARLGTITAATAFLLLASSAASAQVPGRDRISPAAAARTSNPELHIRDVKVEPGTDHVIITFRGRANTPASVDVSRTGERTRAARAAALASGVYRAEVKGLRSGAEYSYAIVLASSDPRTPYRLTGRFRTQRPAADVAAEEKISDRGDFRIRNVQVAPGPEKVVITFDGSFAGVPFVELGSAAPRRNLDGRYEFAADRIIGGYPVGPGATAGSYRVDASVATELKQGTVYHYIITAPSGDLRRPYQVTGEFTTSSRTVRLLLRAIAIVSDSDATGAGELSFHIYVNDRLQHTTGTVRRNDGELVEINREMVLENVPDELIIHVIGFDDDEDAVDVAGNFGARFKAEPASAPHLFGPGRNEYEEWNVARRELLISKEPLTYRHVIPSMSLGRSGSSLAFTVAIDVAIVSR
jgi:hypothetical protein